MQLDPLPLFPLSTVLFPDGVLPLKVFEARYIDLMGQCLRETRPFGVICLKQGAEVRRPGHSALSQVQLEPVGTLATLMSVDADDKPGILRVRCQGAARFRYARLTEGPNGLLRAEGVSLLPPDANLPPQERFKDAIFALAHAVAALELRSPGHFPSERRFTELGWVANRWSELLTIPLAARQQLMALEDPLARMNIIDTFLRQKKVI
ncbi:peptidase S16 [Ideonella sp. TBM-1]|uniref:Peptidase S16 n=1 Tax=Ideonella livida TaxID=2707176 RepID=A0A7C9TN75_9BURK|nr:peptidase S16 [Ideonella livida]